jgi:hypothetical protein
MRTFKKNIRKSIESIEELYKQYVIKSSEFEHVHSIHLNELEEEIKRRSEEFKATIDDIASRMIRKLKESRAIYERQNALNKPFKTREHFNESLKRFKNQNVIDQNAAELVNRELTKHRTSIKKSMCEIDFWNDSVQKYHLTDFTCEMSKNKTNVRLYLKGARNKNDVNRSQIVQQHNDQSNTNSSVNNLTNRLNRRAPSIECINEASSNFGLESQSNLSTCLSMSSKRTRNNDDPDVMIIKRPRSSFSSGQKKILEATFKETKYPTNDLFKQLSEKLKVPVLQISRWFQNSRSNLDSRSDKINNKRIRIRPEQAIVLNEKFANSKYPKVSRLAESLDLPEIYIQNWLSTKKNKEKIKSKAKPFKKEPI